MNLRSLTLEVDNHECCRDALLAQAMEGAYGSCRSANVICHEVAHQTAAGNLVTCQSFSNLALNEVRCDATASPATPKRVIQHASSVSNRRLFCRAGRGKFPGV